MDEVEEYDEGMYGQEMQDPYGEEDPYYNEQYEQEIMEQQHQAQFEVQPPVQAPDAGHHPRPRTPDCVTFVDSGYGIRRNR